MNRTTIDLIVAREPEAAVAFFTPDDRSLIAFIKERLGLDFRYRETELRRRLHAQMESSGCRTLAEFASFLQFGNAVFRPDLAELDSAVARSQTAYRCNFAEIDHVLAHLHSVQPSIVDRELRVLSAGCGGGVECFCFVHRAMQHPAFAHTPIRMVGIDISSDALNIARAGLIPDNCTSLPAHVENGRHICSPHIRNSCDFRRANILDVAAYAAEGPFDVILCRNVLVYFDRDAQEKACFGFTTVLADHGLVVIGDADSPIAGSRYFATLTSDAHILYQKTFRTSRSPAIAGMQGPVIPL